MKIQERTFFTLEVILIILSAVVSFGMTFIPAHAYVLTDIELVLYVLILGLNFVRVKAFNLYQVWVASYIFIIWSEMCILTNRGALSYSYIVPVIRYSLANALVLLGYLFYHREHIVVRQRKTISSSRWFVLVLVVLTLFFIYKRIPSVVGTYYGGRILSNTKGGGSITKSLITALGLILPALIAYYLKILKGKSTLYCCFWVAPIFVVQLLLSTRYKFLFSVVPFLIITDIVNIRYKGKKHLVLLLAVVVAMMLASTFVKNNRTLGFVQSQEEEAFFSDNYVESERLIVRLASNMSPEGVIRMARLADRYFADHSLHYGRETGFVLYFWVPRRFFPEKPTMLDYWLIREYNPLVSEKYTTASGFLGELRADFGWFSLLFVFLFGMLMRRLDDFSGAVFSAGNSSFDMVLASLLYPWVFFFVRSPVTSTISLLWELVLFYGLYILFGNKIKFR